MSDIPLPIQSDKRRNEFVSKERLRNLFAESSDRGKATITLYRAPGTERVPGTPLSNDECRGAFPWKDSGYIVIGNTLYQFIPLTGGLYDIQNRGTLNTSTGRVSFTADLDEVVVADGLNLYVYNTDTSAFTVVSDPDFLGARHITSLNGFTISARPTTGQWQISRPQQPGDWDALDTAVAEASGDNIQVPIAHEERIWLFGTETLEVWVPTTSAFPFDRQVVLPVGLSAPFSAVKADNSIFWLDWKGMVRRTVGYQSKIISNQAVADAVDAMSTYTDAFAYEYVESQHQFYVLTFPDANQTWVYDISTGLWAERSHRDLLDVEGRHHSNCLMRVGTRNLVGDFRDGRVYDMSMDVRSDDQGLQTWEAITPVVHAGVEPLRFYDLAIDAETGIATGNVQNPALRMAFSNNGGKTWSDDSSRSIEFGSGLNGYEKGIRYTRLGRCKSKGRMFRLRGEDDVVTGLIGMSYNTKGQQA